MKKIRLFIVAIVASMLFMPGVLALKKYTVKFNANGGTGTTKKVVCKVDEDCTLTINSFTRKNYSFVEWNTKKNGNGDTYKDQATAKNISNGKSTITLYAQWKGKEFSVTYILNDGKNNPENPTTFRKDDNFKLKNPSREGYTFDGWYKTFNYTGKVTKLDKAQNYILYAKWIENKYSIIYNGNGSTSGKMTNQASIKYTQEVILKENKFSKTNYVFTGWNTSRDGSGTAYQNEATVSKLSADKNGKVTLYAQWKNQNGEIGNGYKITYMLDGGENNPDNPSTYIKSDDIKLKAATKKGYSFGGWYTSNVFNTKSKISKIKNKTGNITLYAKWVENKYTIKYDGNGSTSGKMKNSTDIKYSRYVSLRPNEYRKAAYKFVGWSTTKDGSGKKYSDQEVVSKLCANKNGKVTLYAQWVKLSGEGEDKGYYTIKYDLNGGTNNDENPEYFDGTKAITLKNPTKTGFTFKGWFTTENFDKKTQLKTIKKCTGSKCSDVKVYAKWIENKYTIVFNSNGGTGTMKSLTKISYGESKKLTANAYKRNGYRFKNWNTAKDGTGKTYSDGENVSMLVAKNNGKITLYAQWIKDSDPSDIQSIFNKACELIGSKNKLAGYKTDNSLAFEIDGYLTAKGSKTLKKYNDRSALQETMLSNNYANYRKLTVVMSSSNMIVAQNANGDYVIFKNVNSNWLIDSFE